MTKWRPGDTNRRMQASFNTHNMAVMEHRLAPPDGADDFPTPPWATRAICERLDALGLALDNRMTWEPACGRGFMVRPLEEYSAHVLATDRWDYGGNLVHDFLSGGFGSGQQADFICTNPPFALALQFALKAIDRAPLVALLCRTNLVESADRWDNLFSVKRPRWIFQMVERVPMVQGRCDQFASTATSYAWFVWYQSAAFTTFDWIPPCRKRLEKAPGDYAHIGGSAWTGSQQDTSLDL